MRYMFIDCETSGLMDYKRPADAVGQPRLAELAIIFADEELSIEREYNRYILPRDWEMADDAIAINGLTTGFLRENGIPIEEVLATYTLGVCEGRAVVAHGAQFDCKMLRAELRRAGLPDLFEQTGNICTMRGSMQYKIKKLNGKGGFPGLLDVAAHFDVAAPDKAHGALGDVRCLFNVFKKMVEAGFDRMPAVHHAKDYDAIRSAK